MAHGNPIADGYGVEFEGGSTSLTNSVFYEPSDLV
jgi:hypothetical protein